jgi:radical SAM superfamily enzyme YgiQ (UPF0313 family)
MILNPPSPPCYDVCREWAGGFGIAWLREKRQDYGQSDGSLLQPCLPHISAVLAKEGYEFTVLDCQKSRLNKLQVLKEVSKKNPDVVLSLIGLPSLKKDVELLNSIKEILPSTLIVGLGTTCRVIPEEVLINSSVDVALRSDYPYVANLTKLIEAFKRKENPCSVPGISMVDNGKIVNTPDLPELDLNELPSASYDFFDPSEYHSSFTDLNGEKYDYVPILGSKGCHYGCIYCPYPLGFGRNYTSRPPKSVVDEIEYLHMNYGVDGFLFRDQSFTMSRERAIAMCNEIIRRKLDIAWFCEARVDEVTRELLGKMKDAGCRRIHFGVETGDTRLLGLGKPGVTFRQIMRAFQLTKEAGMWRTAHVILGWPDETLETLSKTYKFVVNLDPDDVNWNTLIPYPGTKLREIAQKNNLIFAKEWSEYTPDTGAMNPKNLTASQLNDAKKTINRNYLKHKTRKLLVQFASGKRKFHLSADDLKGVVKFYISQMS